MVDVTEENQGQGELENAVERRGGYVTVPWEDCMEEAFECKRAWYEGLVAEC